MNPQRKIAMKHNRMRATVTGALFALVCVAGSPAIAQNDVTEATDIQITVAPATTRGPMIAVPVNQGVLVDFNVAVREVRVANPEIADVAVTTPRQILVDGKSFGSTQLIATVEGGIQRVFTVSVDLDLERLEASIRRNVPRARIEVSALLDSVVISGTVPDTESAERILEIAAVYTDKVINHITVAGVQQVMLRCTVAEMNRSATRQLGFNGWMAGDDFQDGFLVNNLNQINPSNIGAASDALATARIPFLTGQDGIPITASPTLSLGFPRVQMQMFIQALRENGLLQVLAEPNLVTISGQEATFLAGGEFPIPVPQRDSVTIEFRQFGVLLSFTPTVVSQNTIRLKVAPEVSEPDYSSAVTITGYSVPGLTQRKVDTVVELAPGQTFAIGGLLSEQTRAINSKVPGVGDIPVLGQLFTSVEYQRSESELVVLVTPELVGPLNPDQIAYVPGADHIPPNDWELFGLGQIEGEGGAEIDPEESRAGNDWPVRPGELYGDDAGMRLRGPIGPVAAEND